MFNADQEFMEPEVLDVLTIAHLLNVQNMLNDTIAGVNYFLERFAKAKNLDKVRDFNDKLFYLEGNLEILNGIIEGKTQNIFEPTIYAEICFN